MSAKWEIDHEGNRILANDARQTIICHISASLKNPDVLKDARLIAAAPELLAALQEFVDGVHAETIKDNTGSVYFHARAAIDKARQ